MYEGVGSLPAVVGGSLAFWTVLYCFGSFFFGLLPFTRTVYEKLSDKDKVDMCIRLTSTPHAVVVSLGVIYALASDKELWDDYIWSASGKAAFFIAVSVGYFAWDTAICLLHFKEHGIGFLMHGIGCLFAYGFAFALDRPFMRFYGCYFLLWELSTPFLNLKFFIEAFGNKDSTLYLVNNMVFAMTFFLVRILIGIYTSAEFWMTFPYDPQVPPFMVYYYLSANFVLNSLNVFWFTKIVRGVVRTFSKKPAKKSE